MLIIIIITTCLHQKYLNICGDFYEEERRRIFSVESRFSPFPIKSSVKRQRNNLFTIWWCFLLLVVSVLHFLSFHRRRDLNWGLTISTMGTKMKGIYKGFKYSLSQIFVVKEDREIDIGFPTDVKHVAHIGWDGPSGTAPTWMNEFRTGPEYAATSIGNSGSALSPWSSQDFGESMRQQSGPEMFNDIPPSDLPAIKKKQKRKKSKSTSSPKSSTSSSRSTRAPKSKAKLVEGNAKPPTNIEVA
ncbi:hypothetical protein ACJIZ3_006583 [Penstemon smallii]|uniref:CRIB domain-containing protein n=1 Tax=Penstemon smallii TaxID=265156 RepID=A0ABD3S8M0_9LAMI